MKTNYSAMAHTSGGFGVWGVGWPRRGEFMNVASTCSWVSDVRARGGKWWPGVGQSSGGGMHGDAHRPITPWLPLDLSQLSVYP